MATQPLTYFRNYYFCAECPNEWSDEMLSDGDSWCPCCDRACRPYLSERLERDDTEEMED